MFLKNTHGYSVEIKNFIIEDNGMIKEFGGSSLDRKKKVSKSADANAPTDTESTDAIHPDSTIAAVDAPEIIALPEDDIKPLRQMSAHTKSKIRKKIIAWSQVHKHLYFLTLTFLNKVEDEQAVNILRKFLDNLKKRKKGFQYLWVAERQKKNVIFPDNIHFHLITNKSIDVKKYVKYWIELQNKNGIHARDESFTPASALDIKKINTTNIKTLSLYMTKYVTKNSDSFKCQVWNCSKHVSALYTAYYTGQSFLQNFRQIVDVEKKIVQVDEQHQAVLHFIPLNQKTLRLYNKLDEKNKEILQNIEIQ